MIWTQTFTKRAPYAKITVLVKISFLISLRMWTNMTIVMINFCLRIPKSGISSPNFKDFCLLQKTLRFDEFQGADFKYNNSFF